MPIERILRLLRDSGFRVLGADGQFIWLEDPTCVTRAAAEFIHYAWIIICVITVFMLFGWAVAIIRAGKIGNIANNMRNLFLIFGILAAAVPAVNAIWGGDLFGRGCNKIGVPIEEVQRMLAARSSQLQTWDENDLYEEFDIYDSATNQQFAADMARLGLSGFDESMPILTGEEIVGANGTVVVAGGAYFGPTASIINSAGLPVAASGHTSGRGNSARRAMFAVANVLPEHELSIMRGVINGFGIKKRSDGAGHLDARRDGGARDHVGTDLYIGGVPPPPGTDVPALFSGRVVRVGLSHTRRGVPLHDVVIQNDNGTVSRTLYVASQLNRGDRVAAGQVIGRVEEIRGAYYDTPQHVHFELRLKGQIIDPESFL
ncbi:MAG: M23 family metallopeptidase [Rickettsiales bacterium]|jgi:hypothetical protein|nr:M23 family metallopeptidase [Rickettsiales bacterium]